MDWDLPMSQLLYLPTVHSLMEYLIMVLFNPRHKQNAISSHFGKLKSCDFQLIKHNPVRELEKDLRVRRKFRFSNRTINDQSMLHLNFVLTEVGLLYTVFV